MINIIVAMTPSGVIGRGGKLPWAPKDLPGEMKWFRDATTGHAVIMGRATWESISKEYRPLSDRENIIVSTTMQEADVPSGVIIARSLKEALSFVTKGKNTWIMGGAQLYVAALQIANELYLTQIHQEFEGDTYFPPFEHLFTFLEDVRKGERWTAKRFIKSISTGVQHE